MSLVVGTNSYVSVEDADTYIADRLGTAAWDAASDTDKAKALVQACRNIERLRWKGTPYSSIQTMQFPRYGLTDALGESIDADTVPQDIKDAQCEEALALLQLQADPGAEKRLNLQRQGVKSAKIGDVQEEYVSQLTSRDIKSTIAGFHSRAAWGLVVGYLLRSPRKVYIQ